MTEPSWSSIAGLYPRPRSKRIYIHRPFDDTLVEVRPDQTVLVKDALGRNGDMRRGYGFAFAASPEDAPRFMDASRIEQSMLSPRVPIVRSWIRQDDFEHRFTLLTTSDGQDGGRIHLYLEVKNAHPSKRRTGTWYFLNVYKPHSQFYIHPNEDYIPFVSQEAPWLNSLPGTIAPNGELSGSLLDDSGHVMARYRVDRRAEVTMADRDREGVTAHDGVDRRAEITERVDSHVGITVTDRQSRGIDDREAVTAHDCVDRQASVTMPDRQSRGIDDREGVTAHDRVDRRTTVTMSDRHSRFKEALCFAIDLGPNERATISVEIPYSAQASPLSEMLDCDAAIEVCGKLWEDTLSGGMTVHLPDAQVQRIFETTTSNHFQFLASSEDPSVLVPGQGGFNDYSVVYSWEVSFYIRALDRLGYKPAVEKILNYFLATQDGSAGPEGDIVSPEGSFRPHIHWMCETGAVLGMLADHYWMTRDTAWFERVVERGLRACRWIIRERNATKQFSADGAKVKHYGLLPAGRPHDWPIKGYFYMSDAYTWRGLNEFAKILVELRRPAGDEVMREAEDYRACILEAVRHGTYLLEDQGIHWVSNEVYTKPGERVGVYSIDGLASLVDAGLIAETDPLVYDLEQLLRNEGTMGDLFSCKMAEMEDRQLGMLQQGFAHGEIDLYYVNASERIWHKIWMLQGEREKALRYFWSTMAYSTTLDTSHCHERFCPQLPWLSPWQPNGSGNGRLFDIIANSLFLFHNGSLQLLPCIPADWLDAGKEIRVEQAQTPFGEVNFSVRSISSSEIAVEFHNESHFPVWISIPLARGTVQACTVQGSDPVEIEIVAERNQARLSGYRGTVTASITLDK